MAPLFLFKLLYFVQYSGYGILSPYIPIFYESLSMSKSQIGILTMIPNVCAFTVAPIFGFIGDKFKAHGEVLLSALVTTTLTTVASLYMPSFITQLPIVLLNSAFRAPIGPGIDCVVMAALEDKTTYGSMRLWGAVSFGIFSLLGGYLTSDATSYAENVSYGPFVIPFYVYAISGILSGYIILSFLYEDAQIMAEVAQKRFIHKQVQMIVSTAQHNWQQSREHDKIFTNGNREDSHSAGRTSLSDAPSGNSDSDCPNSSKKSHEDQDIFIHDDIGTEGKTDVATTCTNNSSVNADNSTIKYTETDNNVEEENDEEENNRKNILSTLYMVFRDNPAVLIFSVVVFLSGFGAGAIDSYLFLHLKELGGSGLLMGIARFLTCVAEVPMFQVAGGLQKRFGTWPMITITQIAFVVRFVYYVLLRDPWTVLPCELLNGLTFAVTWSVSCTYANEISPPGCHSVMQALLEGLHFGVGCGVGSLVGGFIYESYGAIRLFQFCGLLSFFSTILALCAWRVCEKPSSSADIIDTAVISAAAEDEEMACGNSNDAASALGIGKLINPGKKGGYLELRQLDDV